MKTVSKILAVVLGLLLCVNIVGLTPAYANVYGVENPEIVGAFAGGKFDLSSSGIMFNEDIEIVPGDELHTILDIKNTMKVDMKVRLDSVEFAAPDDSFDKAFFNAMQCEIRCGEEVLFSGPWSGENVETTYINIPAGKTVQMEFNNWLPIETGNEAQNGECETVWHFVAESEGEKDDTKVDNKPYQEGVNDNFLESLMIIAVFLMVINTIILLYFKRKEDEKNKK